MDGRFKRRRIDVDTLSGGCKLTRPVTVTLMSGESFSVSELPEAPTAAHLERRLAELRPPPQLPTQLGQYKVVAGDRVLHSEDALIGPRFSAILNMVPKPLTLGEKE